MAEVKEDDLLPGEVSEADLEPEGPSDTAAKSADGVMRRKLVKVAPDLSESIPPAPSDGPRKPGVLDALGLGAGAGLSLGFIDEVFGALSADSDMNEQRRRAADDAGKYPRDPAAGAPPIPGVTSYQLKRPGQPTLTKTAPAITPSDKPQEPPSWEELYKHNRDFIRDEQKAAEESHPAAYGGSDFVGGMLTPVPSPGKAKGLAKVGKYALHGAGVGAMAGLGHSEEETVGGQLGDMMVGGGAGGVLGGVVGGASARLDPWLERQAARKAYKSLDPYMKSLEANLKGKLGRDPAPAEMMAELERLGKRVLDEDIIPRGPLERFATSETLGNRAAAAKAEAGAAKGGFEKMLEDQIGNRPVSLGRLASDIESASAKSALDPAEQKLAKRLAEEAASMRQAIVNRASAGMPDPAAMTLSEAEAMKTKFQRDAYKMASSQKLGPRQQAKEMVARLAREHPERLIEEALGPEDLSQFKAIKGRYGDLAGIADTAAHGAIRDFRNQSVSLGDRLAAVAGSNIGSSAPEKLAGSVAAGALNKIGRQRGAAAMARTLSNRAQTSSLLNPSANALAKYIDALDENSPPPWSKFLEEEKEQ
jgi:hypothetical protein